MNKICTIIVTHKGIDWIEKCLKSLATSTICSCVTVLDNASNDAIENLIRQNFPDVNFIQMRKNIGFGAANNIAIKKALSPKADYIFLLNQDAWIEADTIEKLIKVSEKNKQYGVLSPFHLNYEGAENEKYFNDWVLKQYTPDYLRDKEKMHLKEVYATSFVHAACWLLPIETIESVGLFDPLFFHTGEDNDYIQRLHAKGKLAGIVPGAIVYHNGTNDGLVKPTENVRFLINQSLLLLKDPRATTSGALVLFFKQFLTIHLRGLNRPLAKAYRKNFLRLPAIIKSRKKQKRKYAYVR